MYTNDYPQDDTLEALRTRLETLAKSLETNTMGQPSIVGKAIASAIRDTVKGSAPGSETSDAT